MKGDGRPIPVRSGPRRPDVRPGGLATLLALALAGLPAGCAPGAPSSPGDTTGALAVTVTTSGEDLPEAYEVALAGEPPRHVASNGSVNFEGVAPGTYAVELLAVPGNCAVDGENPTQVAVSEATTSPVVFTVSCAAAPRGDLSVTTVTSGGDPDTDGYGVSIDGGPAEAVENNGTRVFPGLPAGDLQVELTGLADNCAVQGDNPRSIPIADGQTTPTTFAVVCELTTGSIRVTLSTTGFGQDQNGYTVELDGGLRTVPVEPDGTVTLEEVDAGSHTVTLGDIRSTCEVDGNNPVEVQVVAGETADVDFDVECSLF